MTTTRQQLRSYLRDEMKVDPNGRIWSDSILNRNLEKARSKIQSDGHFDWYFNANGDTTFNTVASQYLYPLPTNFIRMQSVTANGLQGGQVLPVPKTDLVNRYLDLTQPNGALPTYYYIDGTNLGLFLPPSGIISVRLLHNHKLDLFTQDSDTTEMDDEFNEALVKYAEYLSWQDIQGKQDKAQEAYQDYREQMDYLFDTYLAGRRDDAEYQFKFETIRPQP